MASPGAIWNPPAGRLPDDDPGRNAGIRVIAHHRDAEPAPPEEVGGALAVDADEVGHHVARALARRG